ncbi:MAG: hypothetical protein K6G31_10805 [Paludibacteraceae bacterium]|nr:hypothetical protein [Paludibacteraceae bacterium]
MDNLKRESNLATTTEKKENNLDASKIETQQQQMTLEEYKKKVIDLMNKQSPLSTEEIENLTKWNNRYWEQLMSDFSPEVAAGINSGLI